MNKFFKQSWWKFLSIALLLYVVIGGLLLPLGPRVIHASSGDNSIELIGMNTHFLEEEASMQIWLMDTAKALFCISNFEVLANDKIGINNLNDLRFSSDLAGNYLGVVVNNDADGNLILINAIQKSDINYEVDASMNCSNQVNNTKSDALSFPNREVLFESVRNLLYHVPMWFAMVIVLLLSFIYSIKFLANPLDKWDNYAISFAQVGVLFGSLGVVTGMIWARSTWGAFWTNDPKLNGAAIGMLIYFAYLILRASVDDELKRGKLAAVYNIFAFIMYIAFIFIIPRLTDSLHPGNGGNPAFSSYDLDNTLRLFFYPACIGWILFSVWISAILIRYNTLKLKNDETYE